MYLTKIKGGKNRQFVYYKLCESYRDEKGKVKHRYLKTLGREDLLLKEDPLAIEKLTQKYGGTRQEKDAKAASLVTTKILTDLSCELQSQDYDFPTLHYGHFVIRHLWKTVLELSRKFSYIQKSQRIQYNLDETACFLTARKILAPSSVLETFNTQDNYLADPIEGVPIDSLYDMFTLVKKNKDSLIKWINKSISSLTPDDRHSLIFYDVTNTYFEAPMTDEERNRPDNDFIEYVKGLLEDDSIRTKLGSQCFDNLGNVIVENLPSWFWEEAAEDQYPYLRMRGPSKEHRTDLPLVSIALVIDRYGFPMDFAIYAGNASEFKTMATSIEALKKKYQINNGLVVADRGLNSSTNLEMLLKNKLGYLMAQKVSNLSAPYKELLLDHSKYVPFCPKHPEYGSYQVVQGYRPKTKQEVKPSSLIFTFNQKRYDRDMAILQAWRNIVISKAAMGVKIGKRKTGWQSLAKLEGSDKDRKIVGVDEEIYNKKKALCGYAAMIYRSSKGEGNTDGQEIKAEELSGIYHQLNQIEDCFRVMKSNLGLRPLYMWNTDHIKGNITVCIIALILVRLIQWKLKQNGEKLTIHQICRALDEARLVCWKTDDGSLVTHPVIQGVGMLRDGVAKMTTEEMIKKVLERKQVEKPIDKIMRVCGLTPIKTTYRRNELARCLKTKFNSDEELVSAPVLAYMTNS